MKRLTFEGNFCDIAMCGEVRGGSFCEDGDCSQRKIWERLKAIEDILCDSVGDNDPEAEDDYDLDRLAVMCNQRVSMRDEVSQRFSLTAKIPLDRLRELAQANREGRVVIPLCKVGDVIYTFSQMRDKRVLPFIREYEITSIRIKKRSILYYHEMDGFVKIIKQSDFGKTAFLTREAAEEALKAREQDG